MSETTPQKVLLVSGSLPPIKCGIGHYTKRLLTALARSKDTHYDYAVVSTSGVSNDGIDAPLFTVPGWRIRDLPTIVRTIAAQQPDIVHIQYPAVGYGRQLGINLLGYWLRAKHYNVVITLHEYHQSRLIGRLRNLITILPASHLVVTNYQDYTDLKRFKHLSLIPLGANLIVNKSQRQDPNALLKQFGLNPQRKTLYFFGFPFPNKGLEQLLDALKILLDYQLVMLSAHDPEDPYHQELDAQIAQLNSSTTRIAWTGFLDDTTVASALKPGSYFVLPQELPLSPKSSTAVTAAQLGQVVIATAGEPSSQTPFRSKQNCLLIPEMTAESIAAAVQQLDSNTAVRQQIISGTAQLRDYFSWPRIVQQHVDVYREVKP